jgi:hypothetical protein
MAKSGKYELIHDFDTFLADRWLLKCEGKPVYIGEFPQKSPYSMNMSTVRVAAAFADQTVAEDFCYLMNRAFEDRIAEEQIQQTADREDCPHDKGTDENGQCNLCGFYG